MSFLTKIACAAAVAVWALLGLPAHAVLFNVSYVAVNGTLEFMVDGTVQSDGDTVVINSVLMTPTFNGVTPTVGPGVEAFMSHTDFGNGSTVGDAPIVPATLTFSGALMDFAYFINGNTDGFLLPGASVNLGPSYGGTNTPFDDDLWSMTPKVPLPAALPLMAGGLAMLGWVGWRRERA